MASLVLLADIGTPRPNASANSCAKLTCVKFAENDNDVARKATDPYETQRWMGGVEHQSI